MLDTSHTTTTQLGYATGVLAKPEALADIAKKFKAANGDAATGLLRIADEAVRIAENWSFYKDEAEGMTVNDWFRSVLGNTEKGRAGWVGKFRRLKRALDRFGHDCKRYMQSEAARFLLNAPESYDDKIREAAALAWLRNNKNPIPTSIARAIYKDICGRDSTRARKCHACQLWKKEREKMVSAYAELVEKARRAGAKVTVAEVFASDVE